jgi:hypothetical protein
LKRKEAYSLLMELISLNLALPSLVTLKKNENGTFDLILEADYDVQALKNFIAKKDLALKIDEEKGFCVISEPICCLSLAK